MISENMLYLEFIRKIQNNEIKPDQYKIFIGDTQYFWDSSEGDLYYKNNMGGLYVKDEYIGMNYLTLVITLTKGDKKKLTDGDKKVLHDLEVLYINLDQQLDACQGCIEGLEEKFSILHTYSELMDYISDTPDYFNKNKDRIYNEYFDRRTKKSDKESKDKEQVLRIQKLLKSIRDSVEEINKYFSQK